MPECAIFKHGVVIDTTSTIRPCCAWLSKKDEKTLYFEDDWQTRHAEWGKRSETEWLDECAECKLNEELTGQSLRKTFNQQFKNETGIKHWDLKINNTCNFACRMCHPGSSSKWANLINDNKEIYEWYGHKELKTRWAKKALEFSHLMLDAKVIKFTGGEPFMIPQVKKIIQRLIDENVSSKIELNLITNGSYDMTDWNHLFEKFKIVKINVSIEATGKRYEYIRPGSSWKQTSENLVKFRKLKPKNSHVSVSVLPMIFNYNNMDEIIDWCNDNGIHCFKSTPVIRPAFMSPDAMKDKLLREQLIEQSEIMDKVYGTNWRDFVNE
jgi:MoaA/NifB/PqqE/SkfB family radical SAM enzyme